MHHSNAFSLNCPQKTSQGVLALLLPSSSSMLVSTTWISPSQILSQISTTMTPLHPVEYETSTLSCLLWLL